MNGEVVGKVRTYQALAAFKDYGPGTTIERIIDIIEAPQ